MSYILEALKKSEYARQQGKVPDLATLPPIDAPGGASPVVRHLPLLAASALLLAVVVAVAGWWRPWQAPPESVAAAPLPARPAASLETAAVPTPTPTSTDPAPAAAPLDAPPPAPVAPEAVAAQPAPPALASRPQPAQPTPPAAPPEQARPALQVQALPPAPKAVLPTRALPPAAPAPATAAPASTALPAPPSRVLAFYELPPVVRERIPTLAVSGFSYAEEPDMRLAVINDRVLRQGESAAPGITLEQIASDGVVLNFSGYRFRPQR